jgi:hypothetical protein
MHVRRYGTRSVALPVALVSAALVLPLLAGPARAQDSVTVFPASPTVGNCIPFGHGGEPSEWRPFAAFFYKNLPAFELKTGDILAFDLGVANDADIQLEIALAPTTTNGGTEESQPFQTVVTNTQTPANPRGDATVGNFELQFTAETPFSFPGGGLIIRFSNPGPAYQLDNTCDQVMVRGSADDASGFFVARATSDADGVAPWTTSPGSVGAFQVLLQSDCDNDGLGDETQDASISSCHPRALILDANKNKVKKGKRVTLSGQLTQLARQAECRSGQPVELQRKRPSQSTFTTVEQLQTDAGGSFSGKRKVKKTFEYRVQVTETATCAAGLSNTEKVKVKKPK